MIRFIFTLCAGFYLAACASTPEPKPTPPTPPPSSQPSPSTASPITIGEPFDPRAASRPVENLADGEIPEFDIVPRARPLPDVDPASLPPSEAVFDVNYIWAGTQIDSGLKAFRVSCDRILKRPADAPFSKSLGIWGLVGDWHPICEKLKITSDAQALRVLEDDMEAVRISFENIDGKFTGYFEPKYPARRRPSGAFTEPILAKPADLKNRGTRAIQTLPNGKTQPYPPRAEIRKGAMKAIAYGRPADVFFLQIQGSGRLELKDGTMIRAQYAGHNGHPFKSTANWLIRRGHIKRSAASMQGIGAWMDRVGPELTQAAMNANPRYIFFDSAPLGDPTRGPAGATGERLTPLGSVAVDPKFIPYHLPLIIQTNAPGLGGKWRGLLISQDTGNAIKGPIRGDLYFGTGFDAGQRAGTMNAPGKLWVLLPRSLTQRLENSPYAGLRLELG